MRNKGKLSKWGWLVLVVAFAAIAGGGCGGSSSPDGGGDVEGKVHTVGETDHPLLGSLEQRYSEMPNGTIFIGNKVSAAELADAAHEIKAAFDEGRIIGMYAPTQARIEELREMLGVDIFVKRASDVSASDAAADEPDPEFYMIRRRGSSIYENRQMYIDEDVLAEVIDGEIDAAASAMAGAEPVGAERKREKSERYGEIAANIAAWHGRMDVDASDAEAGQDPARASISAAAGEDDLMTLTSAYVWRQDCTYADIGPVDISGTKIVWKFPTISNRIVIYSCYSYDDDENWYMLNMDSNMDPADNYEHEQRAVLLGGDRDFVYNSTKSFKVEASVLNVSKVTDPNILKLEDYQPHSASDKKTYTEGVSKNLSGSVGFNGLSPTGTVTGGITYNDSVSIAVEDCEIKSHTDVSIGKFSTEYEFKDPERLSGPLMAKPLEDAPDLSRYNFNPKEAWIWMVTRSENKAYSFQLDLEYAAMFAASNFDTERKPRTSKFTVDLPAPPTLGLDTYQMIVKADGYMLGDDPVTFNVLSGGEWDAKSDSDWVKIVKTSNFGKKTGASPRLVQIMIDENKSRDIRHATITVTGPKGPNGKDQIGTIEITQEGAR